MKEKKQSRGILKRVLVYGSLLLALNQFSPVCVQTCYYNTRSRPQMVTYIGDHHAQAPKDFKALEYLILANSIVHESNKTKKLDCRDTVSSTYDTYLYLVKVNRRHDLKDKVRLVSGRTRGEGPIITHEWIQYKDWDGYVMNFETRFPTSFMTMDEIRDNSNSFRVSRSKVLGKSVIQVNSASLWGTKFRMPTLDLLFYPGGAARIVLNHYFD